MSAELTATRQHRGTLIKHWCGIDSVASPYTTPEFVADAIRRAWLTNGLHALTTLTFTADAPALPLPFGQGRYAAVLKTRDMGTFTGTCETIDQAHCAFADALVAWLEDQGIKC